MGLERKYVVFKADEFDEWIALCGFDEGEDGVLGAMPDELDDAVVIRKQDVFAASGLYAYGTAIIAGVEVMEKLMNSPIMESKADLESALQRLRVLSSSFIDEAIDAESRENKVPD